MESQAGLSNLQRTGVDPTDQAKKTDCSGEVHTFGGTGSHQTFLVDGFHIWPNLR